MAPAHGLLTIDNEVPFGEEIFCRLRLKAADLDNLVKHDEMEHRYLAWETVRKAHNPFFVCGTGFEGYFVGICHSPDEALSKILAVSQGILDAMARLYRFEYGFESRLMKTLTREASDPKAMNLWSAYLGAALARLRGQCLGNQTAQHFRSETYALISDLPGIKYHLVDHDVLQHYVLRKQLKADTALLEITPGMLNRTQQDAWLIATNIGEFGHPLVREFLRQTWAA